MKQVKNKIFYLLLFLFFFGLVFVQTKQNQRQYKESVLESKAILLNGLLSSHPELESDLKKILLDANVNRAPNLLKQYGITEEYLEYQHETKRLEEEMMRNNLLLYFFFFCSIGVFYLISHRRQKKNMQEMITYMEQVLNGKKSFDLRDYNEEITSQLKNEIYKMTNKLNEQQHSLEKEKRYLSETLSDISHQLKTPLTSLYVIQDVLEEEKDEKIRHNFLKQNATQLRKIEWLVTSLLKVSRLDSGMVEMKKKKVNVKKMIEQVILPLSIPIELKNIQILIEGESNIFLSIDQNWVSEALTNILKNSIEHSMENGHIMINIIENPIYTRITIEDNGSGIKNEDLPHIFERFYQGTNASKDSVGIGLNLAQKILELNGGEIEVESKEGKGSTFFITFYKKLV